MRKVRLIEIEATEFKGHVHFKQEFGSVNTIKGINGAGKSSVGEMISWTFGGIDLLGNTFDPTPTDRESEGTTVSTLWAVDDTVIKFTRELIKGKAAYSINDAPKSATEFKDIVYSLTGTDSIDLFMSLLNPAYFPSMHWKDQRSMVFRYVDKPNEFEVLTDLPKLQADKLNECLKKQKLTDLENIHKKNKTAMETKIIAAKARVMTLEGQMSADGEKDLAGLELLLQKADKVFDEAEETIKDHDKAARELYRLTNQRDLIFKQIESIKEKGANLKSTIDCPACKQLLSVETKTAVYDELNIEYKEYKKVYEELGESIKAIKLPEKPDYQKINQNRIALSDRVKKEKGRLEAVKTIEAAKEAAKEVQDSLNESIFILGAIKAFQAREAELQALKVESLFKKIKIRLWDVAKNGNKEATFEIMMDGKPYRKLSTGERYIAGLELIDVLTEQSKVLVPTFVDNAESITSPYLVPLQVLKAVAMPKSKTFDGKFTVEVKNK